LFRKVISMFLFKEIIEEKKVAWPYTVRGRSATMVSKAKW